MKYLVLLSIVLLSLSSFSKSRTSRPEEILIPQETEFEDLIFMGMENFTVERKNGKMYIGFDYVIENPNGIAVVIKPSSMFLKIADQDCGWVRIPEKIRIKRKTKAAYPFMLVGDASNFVKSTFSSIWSLIIGEGIAFNIAGEIKAGVFFFKKKWPMDYTYTMTNEEFMSFF